MRIRRAQNAWLINIFLILFISVLLFFCFKSVADVTIPFGSGSEAMSVTLNNVNGKIFMGYVVVFFIWSSRESYKWWKEKKDGISEKVDSILETVTILKTKMEYMDRNTLKHKDVQRIVREEIQWRFKDS